MPTYAQSQAALIEDMVDDATRSKVAKMGTVAWWSPGVSDSRGLYACGVSFDPGGTAQPVKCFESVLVDVGDRVGLIKYESEWIVTGNYSRRELGGALYCEQFAGSATTTSATFVDMPGSPTAEVTMKYRDDSLLRVQADVSLYATVVSTVVEIAAYVASADGTVGYDEVLFRRAINEANSHRDMGGGSETAVGYVGGQGYSVTLRWRRVSGTGTLTSDTNDSAMLRVDEVMP